MAKANLQLSNGTKVSIEGSADEVAILLQRMGTDAQTPTKPNVAAVPRRRAPDGAPRGAAKRKQRAKGPADYIRDLIGADFFKSKRGLAEVQAKLEERAHIYPVTHLSPVLFRLVRARELRRIKEGGAWKYVNP